jgi:hypothetical protein
MEVWRWAFIGNIYLTAKSRSRKVFLNFGAQLGFLHKLNGKRVNTNKQSEKLCETQKRK